ncbi:MAG: VOC family protein, partial [Polaromonas sp.]
MIRIREIDHLVLRVVDLEAMIRFYAEVLGCSVERRVDELGLVQLRAGRSLVDLVPVDGPLGRAGGAPSGAGGRNLNHVCFRVEPFDETAIRRQRTVKTSVKGLAEAALNAGALERLARLKAWRAEVA